MPAILSTALKALRQRGRCPCFRPPLWRRPGKHQIGDGFHAVAAIYAEGLKLKDLGHLVYLLRGDGGKIAVVYLAFAVGQLLEFGKGFVQLASLQLKAELAEPFAEGVLAGELAKGSAVLGAPMVSGVMIS